MRSPGAAGVRGCASPGPGPPRTAGLGVGYRARAPGGLVPARITGDWVAGAPLTFSDPQCRGPDFGGEVLSCEPPSLLEFSWGTDVIRLESRPRRGCTLTLLDTFPTSSSRRPRYAAGWHVCLELLASHLDSTPGPAGSSWA